MFFICMYGEYWCMRHHTGRLHYSGHCGGILGNVRSLLAAGVSRGDWVKVENFPG